MPTFTVPRGLCRHCGVAVEWSPLCSDYMAQVEIPGKNPLICYGRPDAPDHEPIVDVDGVVAGLLDALRQLVEIA